MTALPRTAAEIKARFHEVEDVQDFFAAERSSLLDGLAFDDAREFLKPEVTAEQWPADAGTKEFVLKCATEYTEFAIGKVLDHRGLSANRSVDHFRGWLWLLDVSDQVDWDDYPQYGAPIIKKVCLLLEMPFTGKYEQDTVALENMAAGRPCHDDCLDGCGA